MKDEISLPEAAHRARLTWPAAHKAALRGDFGPVRLVAGRWLVATRGVEMFLERRTRPADAPLPASKA